MGINSRLWLVRSEQDLAEAISAVDRSPIEALVISSGGGVHSQPPAMERIGNLIARRQLAAITDIPGGVFAGTGCVLAYSADILEILGRLASFIDRILRGASPGELPFELPSKFNLTISAKAAEAIGIPVPPSIMLRADRVIE
jgi:putative ABC transport system substrate-binding protein